MSEGAIPMSSTRIPPRCSTAIFSMRGARSSRSRQCSTGSTAPTRPGEHPDPRLAQIRQAMEALLEPGPGRAETVQRIFSLDYDPAGATDEPRPVDFFRFLGLLGSRPAPAN